MGEITDQRMVDVFRPKAMETGSKNEAAMTAEASLLHRAPAPTSPERSSE